MKIAINRCFGGFSIKKGVADRIGLDLYDVPRTDPKLIKAIETFGSEAVSDTYSHITICEIPDDATDWRISEYDGAEKVIYVLNGKLYDA